jgi:membrane protein
MASRKEDELTLKSFLWALYQKIIDADIFSQAAQVAFYFSFALFPLLFFLITLFGIVLESDRGLKGELYLYLRQVMPFSVFDLVARTVDEIIENSTGGKATLGLLVALWSASAGVDSIRIALNAVHGKKETRSWFLTKTQSIVLTFVMALLIAGVLAIVFYGWQLVQILLGYVGLEVSSPLVLVSIQWASILVVMLVICEVMYNLLPNFRRYRWVLFTPGSIVAIVLWLVLTTAFRTYLGYFNSYNRAYGSLGAVIIMMLWLYLTAIAVMLGGAINAIVIERAEAKVKAESDTASSDCEAENSEPGDKAGSSQV